MSQNEILAQPSDVASRIAARSLARRGAAYADEVRRLLDAALDLMRQRGTTSRPRVADIVAAAGLSNDAFYRHFPSKDALVGALLEDGAVRLGSYLEHQMRKARTPEGRVRRWVEGVLAQADDDVAATTLAVLYNSSGAGGGQAAGRHFASGPLATLLHQPFAELGCDRPELAASFAAHATFGVLSDHLWGGTTPTRDEVDAVAGLGLAVATSDGVTTRRR
jgi:AcrR family transcriptional regulator